MIDIKNLAFSYRKKKSIFRDLNLHFSPGNIYGLLGRNGSGKTTLLKIIAGLVFPQQGSCTVAGNRPVLRVPDLLSDIYFISEEIFVPPLTVREYVSLYSPFYPRFDKNLFKKHMDEFDLSEKEKLTLLSYGQKKKFFVAFGLACNTRVLILDEPTNGLDIPGKSQLRKLLISSIDEDRIFIISTHQVRDIQQLIDPVLILDDGEIIFNQQIETVNEKLAVLLKPDEPAAGSFLFCEKVIGGYAVLCEGTSGGSNIDLEILFNAVMKNREKVCSLFHAGTGNE